MFGTSGALAVKQMGTTAGVTITPGPEAPAGRFSVLVDSLAQPAKARSAAFASPSAPVTGGTLGLSINGTNYDITIDDGATLAEVARAINDSDAPVTAAVLTSGSSTYLSITNRDEGFTVGANPSVALTINENSTGALGQALGLTITQPAANSKIFIDGLEFERMTNTITDALPGVTFGLSAKTTTAADLVLSNDVGATKDNLQKFVDSYNAVMKLVRKNLAISQATDRSRTLGGDPSLRSLQSALQAMVTREVNPGSSVRTLTDLGIRTQTDGTLSIDSTKLASAMANDSTAVNSLFQKANIGLSKTVQDITRSFTDTVDGVLVARRQGLERSVKQADKTIEMLEGRLDKYRERLVSQFTAMEKIVGGFRSIGSYLTQQQNSGSSS